MTDHSMRTRTTASSCVAEPPPKRHAGGDARPSAMSRASRRNRLLSVPPQDAALSSDRVRSIIASYLHIWQLVKIRRVSRDWRALFSEPCCWQNSSLELDANWWVDNDGAPLPEKAIPRVDTMPHLVNLTLIADLGEEFACWTTSMIEQLAKGHNKSLQRLTTCIGLTSAVAAALPALQELVFDTDLALNASIGFDASVISGLPSTLKRLTVNDGMYMCHKHPHDVINALIEHPIASLQHVGQLYASATQIRQLAGTHKQLKCVDTYVPDDEQSASILSELQSAIHLRQLTLVNADCTAELIDALQSLPQLRRIRIDPRQADVAFWQRVPALRSALTNHLPADQRHQHSQLVEFSIVHEQHFSDPSGWSPRDDESDEWWLAALRASFSCSRFEVSSDVTDRLWEQLQPQIEGQTSLLQCIRDVDFSGGLSENAKLFAQLHTNITELHITGEWGLWTDTDNLLHAFSKLRKLFVELWYKEPLDSIVQGLRHSGAMLHLQHLEINTPTLKPVLELVREAVSLEFAKIEAPHDKIQNLKVNRRYAAYLRECTAHIKELSIEARQEYR